MVNKETFRRATSAVDMPLRDYLLKLLLPVTATSLVLAIALPLLFSDIFTGIFALIPLSIPLLMVGGALFYPFAVATQRGHEIDHNMHYFITHLGTLATSQVAPVELFTLIGEKQEEYGALAEECEKIAMLVTEWNMGMSEACRFVAKRTTSDLFSDFLERFAFGIESGTDMQLYLEAEQTVVMADYEVMYKEALQKIEDLQGLFNGALMTLVFLAMFVLLMVVLVDVNPVVAFAFVVLGAAVVEGLFIMLAKSQVPGDPVWAASRARSPLWEKIKLSLPIGIAGAMAAMALVWTVTDWSPPIKIAVGLTPLLIPGLFASREETSVKRRDDNYPGFMRSLGSSTAARGGDERSVLKHLHHHDFGPLSKNIRDLFVRLQVRVDDEASWEYFTTEAGSRLIERFTGMYDEAVDAGGEPDAIGRIISDNMVQIIGLRKLRYQKANTFRGMVFGLAAGTGFSIFIGIGVLELLTGLFDGIGQVDGSPVPVPEFVHIDNVNLPVIQALALTLLLINAAMSSVLVRLVDGGTHVRDLSDFSLLVWVSNVTAWASMALMGNVVDSGLGV